MSQPFQPPLCNPQDLAPLRSLLRRCPTLADVEAELATHLAAALLPVRQEFADAQALDTLALATHLVPLMVQCQEAGGERTALIGDRRLQVRLSADGEVVSYWRNSASAPQRALHEALNLAEWVVTLMPELRPWIQGWLIDQPWFDDLWPVERHELARRLGIALGHALEANSPHLKALLLLRLGYPVGFLQVYLRELGRGTPQPTPAEMGYLLRDWAILRRWPRRARKLVWLALPLREAGVIASLHIDRVRDALRAQGLPRNAWARLHRVPLPQLRDLGLTLGHWQAEGQAADLLWALGLLLSRLGPGARFYRAWRHQMPEVLSDVSSRLAAVRIGQRAPVCGERQQWYRLQRRSTSLRVLNSVVPGTLQAPEQVEKTCLFLAAIARHLLQTTSPEAMTRHREDLSDLVDWFRARSPELPLQAFRGEVPTLLRQSRQWHQRLWQERERREQAARQEQLQQAQARQEAVPLPRPAQRTGPVPHRWPVPLREHAWQDYRFVVLEHEGELLEEAMQMRHCVDSYDLDCQTGECHIVSIRWGKVRVGTMELRRGWSRRWEQVQLKGCRNAYIAADFEMMGQAVHVGIADFIRAFNAAAFKAS